MHSIKAGITGRVGMLAALALLIASVAVLPTLSRPAYAAGLNLNDVVTHSAFIIPGVPTTKLDVKLPSPKPAECGTPANVGPDEWEAKCVNPSGLPFDRATIAVGKPDQAPKLAATFFTCQDDPYEVAPGVFKKHIKGVDANPDWEVWSANFIEKCTTGFFVWMAVANPGWVPVIKDASVQNLAPFPITVADDIDALFPKAGELLLGKTELVVYDNNDPICGPGRASNQFCVTERAKVGQKKQHEAGTQVKLATQLTTKVEAKAASTTLNTTVSSTDTVPIVIDVADDSNFGASGYLTISHSDPVVDMTGSARGSTEYFEYDRSCGTGTQLCLIARAQQPDKENRNHPAHNTTAILPIHSYVNKHFQIDVKSNEGFFPAGNLLVYSVDGSNQIVGAELMGHHNAATNIKDMAGNTTQFHMTSRGANTDTFKPTDPVQHEADSIVTGPDNYLLCRSRQVQPLPVTGTQTPGAHTVGVYSVCYTSSQPNDPTKPPAGREVGQQLIALNGLLGVPFLSTGPLDPIIYPKLLEVDPNGTSDGTLILASPCVTEYGPGSNLQVTLTLSVDKDYGTVDSGTIKVVTDTIPSTPDHTDCDDPSGTGDIDVTTYDTPNDVDDPTGPGDDDTDGDTCDDVHELGDVATEGGLRDPWNKWDFFNPSGDGLIRVDDIIQVVNHYGLDDGDVGYGDTWDRGGILGPYPHNLDAPNGQIRVSDIIAVVNQYGHNCPP